jgi:hypothetical protein
MLPDVATFGLLGCSAGAPGSALLIAAANPFVHQVQRAKHVDIADCRALSVWNFLLVNRASLPLTVQYEIKDCAGTYSEKRPRNRLCSGNPMPSGGSYS